MKSCKEPLVSVILPAYNVGKYIERCIESIIKQTYQNIEIIVVDDGSKDDTYLRAFTMAETDSRIKLFHQENAGSGPARNVGLKNSNGTFIMFVDPDDWIKPEMIEELIELQNTYDADMVISGYIENYETDGAVEVKEKPFPFEVLKNMEESRSAYMRLFLEEAISAPTRIIYKKKIIDDFNVSFPDLRRSQDIVFNYRYYSYVKCVVVTDKVYYEYQIDGGNYINKLKQEYASTIKRIYSDIISMHEEWGIQISSGDWVRFNNRFLVLLGYYVESGIQQGYDFGQVFQDETLISIAHQSRPIDGYHKVLKVGFERKNKNILKVTVRVKLFAKANMKYIFSRMRTVKKY